MKTDVEKLAAALDAKHACKTWWRLIGLPTKTRPNYKYIGPDLAADTNLGTLGAMLVNAGFHWERHDPMISGRVQKKRRKVWYTVCSPQVDSTGDSLFAAACGAMNI